MIWWGTFIFRRNVQCSLVESHIFMTAWKMKNSSRVFVGLDKVRMTSWDDIMTLIGQDSEADQSEASIQVTWSLLANQKTPGVILHREVENKTSWVLSRERVCIDYWRRVSCRHAGLSMAKSDHLTWILASDWPRVITWPGHTSLWLVCIDYWRWLWHVMIVNVNVSSSPQ